MIAGSTGSGYLCSIALVKGYALRPAATENLKASSAGTENDESEVKDDAADDGRVAYDKKAVLRRGQRETEQEKLARIRKERTGRGLTGYEKLHRDVLSRPAAPIAETPAHPRNLLELFSGTPAAQLGDEDAIASLVAGQAATDEAIEEDRKLQRDRLQAIRNFAEEAEKEAGLWQSAYKLYPLAQGLLRFMQENGIGNREVVERYLGKISIIKGDVPRLRKLIEWARNMIEEHIDGVELMLDPWRAIAVVDAEPAAHVELKEKPIDDIEKVYLAMRAATILFEELKRAASIDVKRQKAEELIKHPATELAGVTMKDLRASDIVRLAKIKGDFRYYITKREGDGEFSLMPVSILNVVTFNPRLRKDFSGRIERLEVLKPGGSGTEQERAKRVRHIRMWFIGKRIDSSALRAPSTANRARIKNSR